MSPSVFQLLKYNLPADTSVMFDINDKVDNEQRALAMTFRQTSAQLSLHLAVPAWLQH